ncbi:inactive polypeptide N-acetylgalactosaminyltransferase-like protein 5 [Mus musculus]|uniref:Inactive polypeptide N-acetylgalactosaminyltransferase-like protein 5 n=1 Tax=Mus musculus TaxID=10090 RepID=GLTL5_MOUSE|nr:inactive polypeptide N-acetylgalactosaminyltransferase-like protein 5 [Mus musculus]Q9D4M9.2 RecName: Full=Inactive polypeptide N-acetylgalactosaminyltransferase-like protein 5; AltName: Full=Polypeptide GalNAc transferase 15; Short=GalNAc-T15; Short=pp-GaNTase 15; AltName: Full=Protein-UDP acetylgalactosaminyltransferase 15; AltName: Full=UDP-GalNAc:polypeptide N-acetylgalactosaminyltransferase 15 [Mus musculus]AAI45758.1 UDP-N-acetyl-alpha-D-galactosamine:polypeptide N-acetylgalactosaminyltr|eukprot:NP_080725.2 inactive polypeptide N-acetylgalactosaminyltransferase-like protein 5 [Mus musculus]
MKSVIIQGLFCGFLAIGLWASMLLLFLHLEQEDMLENEKEELLKKRSLGKNAHQQTRHSEDVTHDEVNFSDPELIQGLRRYGLNAIMSRRLGIEREVPDSRDKICQQKHYPFNLPTASIIICFYNEEFNTLLRAVSSVVNLSPQHLLEEIILVDDMSEFDDLKDKLDYYLEIFRGKVKLIRNKKREGLIRSKMIGASRASGDILVFLDSHCEVNRVWLEPLLHAIAKDHKMVVCPIIDVINELTLDYMAAPIVRGAFDWNLNLRWDNVFAYELDGPEGPSTPIRSPAMTGGIFAINRHYFNELGQYDNGMDICGGENVELSLRIWMCGGQLFILPCSRVGYNSKALSQHRRANQSALSRNLLRVVHVWLDEYKGNFFLQRPSLTYVSCGNISERVELRKRLGCKSFQWYLDNIFPELEPFNTERKRKKNRF